MRGRYGILRICRHLYAIDSLRYTLRVTDQTDLRKLNAIVGAAIKALAVSGADAEFVAEFAVSHRAEVAAILGPVESTPPKVLSVESPDLLAIVKQAVSEVVGGLDLRGKVRPARVTACRVNVTINGKRTCITISRSIESQLVQATGGWEQAKPVIQEIADTVPSSVNNKSAWIADRLKAYLAFREQALTGSPQTE